MDAFLRRYRALDLGPTFVDREGQIAPEHAPFSVGRLWGYSGHRCNTSLSSDRLRLSSSRCGAVLSCDHTGIPERQPLLPDPLAFEDWSGAFEVDSWV
jgi:hypothetical protein